MPRLTDPAIRAQFQTVLANWNFTGYVTAKDVALEWITAHLVGMTLKDVARAMNDFVAGGGEIDQQPEHRPEWSVCRSITISVLTSPAASFTLRQFFRTTIRRIRRFTL
jgi:hypothetical protein